MDYKTELALWIVVSLSFSILGSWLAWRFRRARSRSVDWLKRRLLERTSGQILLQLVRMAYYVGLPYVAVLRHALSLVVVGARGQELSDSVWWMLGWKISDWAHALSWIVSIGAVIALISALGWWNAVRAQEGEPIARGLWPAPPWWVTLREVLYNEIHWAFYRAGPLLIFDDAYWGILVSAAFPLIEWVLDPDWWLQMGGGPRREQVLMQCMWLATSTICFLLARNVWLGIALHLALELAINRWLAFLVGREDQATALSA